MSARIVHLERADRGAVLAGLRLVGPRSEESWTSPLVGSGPQSESSDSRLDPAGDAQTASREAAAWLAERLRSAGGARKLDRLVLDADGAVCSWVTASGIEPKLVRALVEQHSGADDRGGDEGAGEAGPGRFPDLPPGELTVQALVEADAAGDPGSPSALSQLRRRLGRGGSEGEDADAATRRLAVLAMPEAPARLLLDELDRAGIEVGSVGTVFQAAAAVWDATARAPAGGATTGDDGVIDAEPATVCTAVLLVEPDGRLVWCWSVKGGVAVSGSARLAGGVARSGGAPREGDTAIERRGSPREVETPSVRVTSGVLARVTTEWLSWSAQLGIVPGRVVVVAPFASLEVGPASSNGAAGLDAPGIASALRRALPSATVDLVDDDDPVGLTLRRLAELHDDGAPAVRERPDSLRRGLTSLTRRPGRAHKAMYRWSAAALIAASAALSVVSWRLLSRAEVSEQRVATLASQRRALLERVDPSLIISPFALRELENRVQASRAPTGSLEPAPPVVPELEALSYVLGNPDIELQTLSINQISATFNVTVPDIEAAEALRESLRSIYGSSMSWSDPSITRSGSAVRVSATGLWRDAPGGGG